MNEDKELPNEILNFTTAKIVRDRQKICQCKSACYIVDTVNRLVTCRDCGAYIDPFDAMVCIARNPARMIAELEALRQQRLEIVNYKPHMVVFRNLEKMYRKTSRGRMMPCCPKCSEVFRFEDITGWTNERWVEEQT